MSDTSVLKDDLPNELLWRLSVDKYHEMIRVGILSENDRVELIEGWLVGKMPNNPAHTFSTERSRETIEHVLPKGYFVNAQQPVTTPTSEPEPDVAVIRGAREAYLAHHPYPENVVLIIEISDSTLRYDRTTKQRLYAQAGVKVYWIVNLVERQLEVYTNPSSEKGSYEVTTIYALSEHVPFIVDGQEVGQLSVQQFFPRA
jgi:Uma2 family endonuclease